MSNEGGQEEKEERKGKKRDAILRMLNLRFERKSRGGGEGKRKRVHLF